MRHTFDTPDGLEVALELSVGDIEVDVRDTTTTTVEIGGYETDAPPVVRCEPTARGGHRVSVEHKIKKKGFSLDRGLDIRLVVPAGARIDGAGGAAGLGGKGTLAALSLKTGAGGLPFPPRTGDAPRTR